MALFIRATKLDPWPHCTMCVRTKTVHHAVGISRRRNSGYRPSSLKYHGIRSLHFPLPSPPLALICISPKREVVQQSLMVSHYTILVPFFVLHIGPACEAGLSTGMRRERVSHRRKKRKKHPVFALSIHQTRRSCQQHQLWSILCFICPKNTVKFPTANYW